MSKTYKLHPKNGKGSVWYTHEIFSKNGLVKVFSKDGFETIAPIDNYWIEVYSSTREENPSKNQKGQGPVKKTYKLRPKNGKGCVWYTHEIFSKTRWVKAFSKDGFETIVEIDNYWIEYA